MAFLCLWGLTGAGGRIPSSPEQTCNKQQFELGLGLFLFRIAGFLKEKGTHTQIWVSLLCYFVCVDRLCILLYCACNFITVLLWSSLVSWVVLQIIHNYCISYLSVYLGKICTQLWQLGVPVGYLDWQLCKPIHAELWWQEAGPAVGVDVYRCLNSWWTSHRTTSLAVSQTHKRQRNVHMIFFTMQ